MTRQELELTLDEFRRGLEAELALLRQLQAVAAKQRAVSDAHDFDRFQSVSDERDRLTRNLLAMESGLAETRAALSSWRDQAADIPVYGTILALRQASTDLVNDILTSDRESMRMLADAEVARRAALSSLERGENTLAAYRRVLAPPATNAGLIDSRG
ncbi:MAG: hypothetical protein U0Q11_02005 [Vicinamibacterales bacterium]